MDFDDLLVFRSVARCRTLTKAVSQTGFSQSAISRRVQRLERELDATLLDRRTLPASLTEAGREFLTYADGVLEGRRVLDDRLSHSSLSGTLRVACSSAPADFGIPELVGTFLRSEPGVTVQWLAASSRTVQAQVVQGVPFSALWVLSLRIVACSRRSSGWIGLCCTWQLGHGLRSPNSAAFL